jgi:hypothetical protein
MVIKHIIKLVSVSSVIAIILLKIGLHSAATMLVFAKEQFFTQKEYRKFNSKIS